MCSLLKFFLFMHAFLHFECFPISYVVICKAQLLVLSTCPCKGSRCLCRVLLFLKMRLDLLNLFSTLIRNWNAILGICTHSVSTTFNVKRATSHAAKLFETFGLKFSISLFVIRVNPPSLTIHFPLWSIFVVYLCEVLFFSFL